MALSADAAPRGIDLGDLDAYLGGAVEGIVRYSTPIVRFRRTVAVDHRVRALPFTF
ncbi:hypothetical protein [Kitasatospora sp. NPDC004272]